MHKSRPSRLVISVSCNCDNQLTNIVQPSWLNNMVVQTISQFYFKILRSIISRKCRELKKKKTCKIRQMTKYFRITFLFCSCHIGANFLCCHLLVINASRFCTDFSVMGKLLILIVSQIQSNTLTDRYILRQIKPN